jgi:hypothetical protein
MSLTRGTAATASLRALLSSLFADVWGPLGGAHDLARAASVCLYDGWARPFIPHLRNGQDRDVRHLAGFVEQLAQGCRVVGIRAPYALRVTPGSRGRTERIPYVCQDPFPHIC